MDAKVQYYIDIIEAMGDPDLDTFAGSNENALDIISLLYPGARSVILSDSRMWSMNSLKLLNHDRQKLD
jgi:hypothetical protein